MTEEFSEPGAGDANPAITNLKKEAWKTYNEWGTRKSEIKDWTVTEEWVRVRTTRYSGIVLTIAIGIIGGSLSVPFLVADRIEGVDPFQFVTFSWLLAGAFLVGAKSRYVTDWPWHDFLRGQIVCRTVSELAVASRVKKQAVLLDLLHNEFRNRMLFRGPYHGAFRRRAKSGTYGFSIDVPVEYATLLAAGFIVLKIRTIEEDTYHVHFLLHDTRDGVPSGPFEKSLISEPLNGNEKQTLMGKEGKERVSLNLEEKPGEYDVLGLPISDCTFI